MVEKKVLYTWLGMTDIKKSQAKEAGPIVNALSFAEFDALRILTDQSDQVNQDFKKNLPKSIQNATEMISVSLPEGPTNHQSIFEIVYNEIKSRLDENEILFYHVSSGTPAMHAIWLIVSQAYFSGTLPKNEFEEVDMPVNVLELNIAVDKRNKPKACVGKALLNKAEEIAIENGFEEIRGVVKYSNLKRNQVTEWLLNNGFEIENNSFDTELNKKLIYCKRLFSRNLDITFVKRF